MIIAGNLLTTVAGLASSLVSLYTFVIFISVIISWVNADPYNPIVRALRMLTEPALYRIRKWFPFVMMGSFDLSPIVLLFALQLFDGVVIRSIYEYGLTL